MGNKETKRTIMNMFNYCILITFLFIQLGFAIATETKAETENALNATFTANNSTSALQPVAEPLTRYRRQPPRTIVKHIMRPKRMKMKRAKRPKIRYSFAEPPPNYYRRKPSYSSSKGPAFDSSMFEDFSHYNVESTDFGLPPSSYEAQSMNLDLYKNYEAPAEASYKEIQNTPSYKYAAEPEVSYKEPEFSYKEIEKAPTYEYAAQEVSYKEPDVSYEVPEVSYKAPDISYKAPTKIYTFIPSSETREPHTKYGVPTELVYNTGYDKPSGNKYSYETPAHETPPTKHIYTPHSKNQEYFYSAPKENPPRIPSTKYGVPDIRIPSSVINDFNKYSVIQQNPSFGSYTPTKTDKYNFAEPPQPETKVEITYSPSYEINIPTSKQIAYGSGKYSNEHQPPAHQPPAYEQSPKYEDSPQQYDYPEQSNKYETPPQQQQNYDQHPGYQESSDTNQPPTYHPAPPPSPPQQHASIEEYIPHTQDLPINVNHKPRPYNYPKSSYEVPIYDAIPFDASNNQQHEIYPPEFDHHSNSQHNSNTEYIAEPNNISEQRPHQPESEESPAGDAHSTGTRPLPQSATSQKPISPINRLRRTRKRKRQRGSSTTTSTTKHILDVPELQEAFENENRNRVQNEEDADINESQKIQNINVYSGPWNPMKIRTSSLAATTPSSTSAVNTLSTVKRRFNYKQRSSTTTSTTTTTTEPPLQENNIPKVEIISIEKSRSKTLYDGMLSTPKVYNTNLFRNRFKIENHTTAFPAPQRKATNENKFSKRTTKNVFDTTVFKSPLNDRDLYHNLPKNHKLF